MPVLQNYLTVAGNVRQSTGIQMSIGKSVFKIKKKVTPVIVHLEIGLSLRF